MRRLAMLCMIIGACARGDREAPADSAAATAVAPGAAAGDPDPAGAARERIGVRFDPLRVAVGDSVAGLAVERVAVTRAAVDSTPVGTVVLRGPLVLAGAEIPHFDADARDAVCFEADSASATRMPRWAGDRRRPWFCFSNAAEARRAMGAASPGRVLQIRIDRLVINRGLSDQVNEARFAGLVQAREGTR